MLQTHKILRLLILKPPLNPSEGLHLLGILLHVRDVRDLLQLEAQELQRIEIAFLMGLESVQADLVFVEIFIAVLRVLLKILFPL